MYNLYSNKKEGVIKIQKATRLLTRNPYPEEPAYFNDCYIICASRKPLKELGQQMKASWVKEAEEELEKISKIKI